VVAGVRAERGGSEVCSAGVAGRCVRGAGAGCGRKAVQCEVRAGGSRNQPGGAGVQRQAGRRAGGGEEKRCERGEISRRGGGVNGRNRLEQSHIALLLLCHFTHIVGHYHTLPHYLSLLNTVIIIVITHTLILLSFLLAISFIS